MKELVRTTAAIVGLLALACACGDQGEVSSGEPDAQIDTVAFETSEGTDLRFDISPEGSRIVFDLLGQLWLLPAEGGEARPITDAVRDTADDRDPVFSPDGRRILFRSNRPGGAGYRLFVIPADGGSARRLTAASDWLRTDMFPAWAPDGQEVAFVRGNELVRMELASLAVDTVRIEGLPSPGVRDPSWSPGDETIVFVNANRSGWGRVWEVPAVGGEAGPVTAENVSARNPVFSPDGTALAMFVRDSARGVQVWARSGEREELRPLTDHEHTHPSRLRWSPDGKELIYSADGRLWRTGVNGSTPREIPFRASVRFERRTGEPSPVTFPEPGDRVPARGFRGLGLSPDGERLGLIALGGLWLVDPGGRARQVAEAPASANELAWSPDGRKLLWSAGPTGEEDLYAVSVESGAMRRITGLPGQEIRPSWSPDGRFVAFVHVEEPAWEGHRLRVLNVASAPVTRLDDTRDLAPVPLAWGFEFFGLGSEAPQWSSDSDALLVYEAARRPRRENATATLVPLDGEPRELHRFPLVPTFFQWLCDGTVTFVQNDQLWRGRIDTVGGAVVEASAVGTEPSLYATAACDGSVAYVSAGGLRIRRPDGETVELGWPLQFEVPVPPPLLVRNVRLVGRGEASVGGESPVLHDILIENGRIADIRPARDTPAAAEARVIDARGRWAIPGLIDLHGHIWQGTLLPGLLYHGVTTVRDAGSPLSTLAALRDEVDAGLRPGPRVVAGGFQFTGRSGLTGATIQEPANSAGLGWALVLLETFGAAYAKHRTIGDWVAVARIVRAAQEAGFTTSGHCVHALATVAVGVDGKEHLGPSCEGRSDFRLYDDMKQLFRVADLWVVPTIASFTLTGRLIDDPGLLKGEETAPFLTPRLRWWGGWRSEGDARSQTWYGFADRAREAARDLSAAGVPLGAGTDPAGPPLPWTIHAELEELVAAGLTPAEALGAATQVAARIISAERDLGAIEEGKIADLVILQANPLEDIRNTREIWRVIKGGEVMDREALLTWMQSEWEALGEVR